MNKLSRIEDFLDNYSWLLKSVIVVIFFLWVMQGHIFVSYMIENIGNFHFQERKPEIEEKMDRAIYPLFNQMIEEAESKGPGYGPRDYFNDLKKFKTKKYEIGKGYPYEPPFLFSEITKLQSFFMSNINDGFYSYEDLERERNLFLAYAKNGGPAFNELEIVDDETFEKDFSNFMGSFANWAYEFYLRGFFLVIALFITRMATRQGILGTFLADKKRFFLAVILWPLFLFKYPYNVVREIVVEAELRRLGGIFRRLSDDEREFIKQVAEGSGFWSWLKSFNEENQSLFQRSFAFAILTVILVHSLPVIAEAESPILKKRGDPTYYSLVQVIDNAVLDEEISVQFQNDSSQGFFVGLNQLLLNVEIFEKKIFIRLIEKTIRLKLIIKEIGHIPIIDYLFVRCEFTKTQ